MCLFNKRQLERRSAFGHEDEVSRSIPLLRSVKSMLSCSLLFVRAIFLS